MLGCLLGCPVGTAEGSKVGEREGVTVGTAEGVFDGSVVEVTLGVGSDEREGYREERS